MSFSPSPNISLISTPPTVPPELRHPDLRRRNCVAPIQQGPRRPPRRSPPCRPRSPCEHRRPPRRCVLLGGLIRAAPDLHRLNFVAHYIHLLRAPLISTLSISDSPKGFGTNVSSHLIIRFLIYHRINQKKAAKIIISSVILFVSKRSWHIKLSIIIY